jgi:hypothetical protein
MPTPFEFMVVLLAMSKAFALVGGAAMTIYLCVWSLHATAQRWRLGVPRSTRFPKQHAHPHRTRRRSRSSGQ